MAQLLTFEARDAVTIRDGILRVIFNGLAARGVPTPNVTPGSDWFVFAQGVANELAVVEANAVVMADQQMPDSANGAALARICAIYGLSLQGAAGSAGPATLQSSATTVIAAGQQLTDSAGLRYRLVAGGVFANGATLNIEAVDLGAATNHSQGDVLRWKNAPPFSDEKVIVGIGGLINGHDAETYEGMRARLFATLRNPPRSGNWEHVAELAEQSSLNVEKGFVMPALQGPATVHVAVTAAPTATNKNRNVSSAIMTGTVVPYVQGQLPEHAFVVTTTVVNVPAEVSFSIVLPEAPTASPPGPGGGWLDGTPWPDAGPGQGTRITAIGSGTSYTVNAVAAPLGGVSRVMWIDRSTWTLVFATVIAPATGSSGAWVISLDQPLVGAAPGDFLSPACVDAQVYLDAVFTAFSNLGPGEKTADASALLRGFRRPRPSNAWPYALGPQMTKWVVESSVEIDSASFLYRKGLVGGGAGLTGPNGLVVPVVPATVGLAPNIFVPYNIGFYRAT